MSKPQSSIKREMAMLSRYIGFVAARFLTAALAMLSILRLSPSCAYIAVLGILLPMLLQAVINEDKKKEPEWQLPKTMKKYHFSYIRYRCEQGAAPILLLFLAIWQYALTRSTLSSPWNIYPAMLFVLNIVSRIIIMLCFRIYLHFEFTNMKQL
ncbi:MAG: hypothetical protein J1E62_02170 [Lachnospiraceae bacterium]|nr:hypothetical protein [Lachnospiraceae bacterium]